MISILHISLFYESMPDSYFVDFHFMDSGNTAKVASIRQPVTAEKAINMNHDDIIKMAAILVMENYGLDMPSAVAAWSASTKSTNHNKSAQIKDFDPSIKPVFGISEAVEVLPGILEKAKHPVNGSTQLIKNIIMDLNDNHKWSRERVADWLDTLDVDLSFKSPDDTLREEKAKKIAAKKEFVKLAEANVQKASNSLKIAEEALKLHKHQLQILEDENEQD